MLDTKELAAATAVIVKEHVGVAVKAAVDPLLRRIEELEQRALERGEPGAPGKDGADGRDGSDGRDGKDAEPVTAEQVGAAVSVYLASNPPAAGKDGRDGVDGKDGRDGLDLKDLFRAEGGRLVAVLSDGSTKDLGTFVGRDGQDGQDGRDGADGKDGADGLGFDDLDMVECEDGLALRFVRGETVKEFPLPVVVDRGVWREKAYRKGSGVTWGGSFWIAQRDTDAKPDSADSGWRLAVKRGRDGREVVTVKPRKDGPVKA